VPQMVVRSSYDDVGGLLDSLGSARLSKSSALDLRKTGVLSWCDSRFIFTRSEMPVACVNDSTSSIPNPLQEPNPHAGNCWSGS